MARNILNAFMAILLLMLMDYRSVGNAFHEISGSMFLLLFVSHNVLNWRWYTACFKGRRNLRRMLLTGVNLFLAAAMITVFVTGALISATVFAPLDIRSASLLAHDLHQGTAYAAFILSAIHLGLHWEMLMAKLRNWRYTAGFCSGWPRLISRFICIVMIAYGINASFENHIGQKLFMEHIFSWDKTPSFWKSVLDYLAIMGCYVGITHGFLRLLGRGKE